MPAFLRWFLLFSLSVVMAVACRSTDDLSKRRCLIQTISTDENAYVDNSKLTFEYNANQQLTKATLSFRNTQATLVQSFSYSPGRVHMVAIPTPTESGVVSATYALNAAGYVTSIRSTERVYGIDSLRVKQQTFWYSEEGYLTDRLEDNGLSKNYTYYQQNFFVERRYIQGLLFIAYNFVNSPDKPMTVNPLEGLSVIAPFYAQGLFGRQPQNRIDATTNARGTIRYAYEYDDRNNATRIVITDEARGGTARTSTLNYTYNCP